MRKYGLGRKIDSLYSVVVKGITKEFLQEGREQSALLASKMKMSQQLQSIGFTAGIHFDTVDFYYFFNFPQGFCCFVFFLNSRCDF